MGFSKKAIFVLLGVLLLGSGLVMAIRGATVSGATDLTRWTAGTAGSDTTEGGNITSLNLDSNTLTDRWAGYFGNVTGYIYLTDASGATTNYLFRWNTTNETIAGEVCASTNDTYNFATATGLTSAGNIDSAWGFSGGADLATATYNSGTCGSFTFDEQGVTISNAVKAQHHTPSTFYSCAINNTAVAYKGDLAFCTPIQTISAGKNYLNQPANFELIVPANDTNGATETYYFYAEIN